MRVSFGQTIKSNKILTKSLSWSEIIKALSKITICNQKNDAPYFIGGYFTNNTRNESSLVERTLMTIDVDDITDDLRSGDSKQKFDFDALIFELTMRFDFAYYCYTTRSFCDNNDFRVRIVIPLLKPVTASEYTMFSKKFVHKHKLFEIGKIDAITYTANSLMFLPSKLKSSDPFCSHAAEGSFLDLYKFKIENDANVDLESMVNNAPLDFTVDDVQRLLDDYVAENLEYDKWLRVGMALYHQSEGLDWGYDLWVAWSKRSSKHDERYMPTKWRSFKSDNNNNVTIASVIYERQLQVKKSLQSTNVKKVWHQCVESADEIKTMEDYDHYKATIGDSVTEPVTTALFENIVSRTYGGFGKAFGLSKSQIKKELSEIFDIINEVKVPRWLEGWYYLCFPCRFFHIKRKCYWKREAFESVYGREMECVINKTSAAKTALNHYKITCVEDRLFMPCKDDVFIFEDKKYVNLFEKINYKHVNEVSEHPAVKNLINHIKFLFSEKKEQDLMLSWIAFIVQNPEKRVRWSPLICGPEGIGKTYLLNLLQMVYGKFARPLDGDDLKDNYTGWGEGSIVTCIEEIYVAGDNRHKIMNKLKPFITNDTIRINEKYEPSRTIPNMTSYLMLTNYPEALPLDENDRRYCIISCRFKNRLKYIEHLGGDDGMQKYFKTLFSDMINYRNELISYLMQYKLNSIFKVDYVPLFTKAKRDMINARINPNEDLILDAISDHECDVINNKIVDVTYLRSLCEMSAINLPPARSLSWIMRRIGYCQIDSRKIKLANKNHYVWYNDDWIDEVGARDQVKLFFNQ